MVNSRQKGKRAELQLAHKLQEWGFPARRSQQFAGINGDADVVGCPYLHIECKAVERLNIHDAMNQSKRDAKEDEYPVVIHKKNRTPWLITMELDDFEQFYKAYLEKKYRGHITDYKFRDKTYRGWGYTESFSVNSHP